MKYAQQKISTSEAEKILFDLYLIKGTASPLPGYVDFNFRIKIENEEGYILKISRVEENKKYLEYQQHLLQFIENSDEEIIAPKAVTDKNNHLISEILFSHPMRMSPAAARMIASRPSVSNFLILVSRLPRRGTKSRSGR